MAEDGAFLLDTHVWLWLQLGEGPLRLSPALAVLEKGRENGGQGPRRLLVSAVSLVELAMLEARGKVRFHLDCRQWVEKALKAPGLALHPLTPEIAVESARLPGYFQGDWTDRVLVATARNLNATLVTADGRIQDYAGKKFVKALAV